MQQTVNYIENRLEKLTEETDARRLIAGVYGVLSQYVPIDTMHASDFNAKSSVLASKAFVVNRKALLLSEELKISDEAIQIASLVKGPTVLVFNNSSEHSFIKDIAGYLKVKGRISVMGFGVQAGPGRYLVLSFAAYGTNRYNAAHADLIKALGGGIAKALKALLDRVDDDSRSKSDYSGLLELRGLLDHQRMDLVLNSQDGLKSILNQIEQVAPLDSPVLIQGETGVGKDLIANSIHQASNRAHGPMIAVNCGAIPESLLDSELFGFEKGAFTGADRSRAGYFEQAHKGTLFLDEVGELSFQAQTKLLRVLQNSILQRVGGVEPISIDVRIIAATNRNLRRLIQERKFRPDLWYRLDVFPINMPPLRDRKRDIPVLVQYLMDRKLFEMNLPFEPRLSPGAMDRLIDYDWPGNIRELQNVIERELILCKGEPMSFNSLSPQPARAKEEASSFEDGRFLTMDQMMIRHIRQSLKMSKGKVDGPGGAAQLLGMNPSTLRARMKKLNITISRVPSGRLE